MNLIADETQQLQELDEQERSAWTSYRDRLRDLSGDAYDQVEDECWQELQRELRRVTRRRRTVEAGAAASV